MQSYKLIVLGREVHGNTSLGEETSNTKGNKMLGLNKHWKERRSSAHNQGSAENW